VEKLRKGYKGKPRIKFQTSTIVMVKNPMTGRNLTESKIGKTLLVLLTAFLIFAGPTYMVYIMQSVLNVPYALSMIGGLVLFLIGVLLLWFLIRKRVISEE
jgi:protein-S-isoprenylcysteine O-methyltransferase Ste14